MFILRFLLYSSSCFAVACPSPMKFFFWNTLYILAGQTDHGKGKRPRWLDPNISSNSWKKSTKLNEENDEDRRSFVEEKNDKDDVNNVSGVEISYVSDSGSDPEHEVISESNINYTTRNKVISLTNYLLFTVFDIFPPIARVENELNLEFGV